VGFPVESGVNLRHSIHEDCMGGAQRHSTHVVCKGAPIDGRKMGVQTGVEGDMCGCAAVAAIQQGCQAFTVVSSVGRIVVG
jgi:hypothetical protein